jgi:hypothetical protein
MARLIPPASAKKLRLVYSTACFGASEERLAWQRLGARTVVTHVGINDPLVALPYILSRWIAGAPIGRSVAEAFRETVLGMHLVLSFPNVANLGIPSVDGSRPMIWGDEALTIRSGAPAARIGCPAALTYSRQRGGPVGLALRGLAGRLWLGPADVKPLFERLQMPMALPDGALTKVTHVGPTTNGSGEGQLALVLSSQVDVPLPDTGVKNLILRVGEQVALRPGVVDVERHEVEVHAEGLWLKKGLVRIRLSHLTLTPPSDGHGWRARASGGLWGFIPVWKTFDLGGSAPLAAGDTRPVRAPATVGISGRVGAVALNP